MKNQLSMILALIFVITFTAKAQVEEDINKGFLEMQSAIIEKDFNKSVEYIADELFELVPKDQLVKIMEATMNNPQMEVVSTLPKILSTSKPEKEGEKYYSIIESNGLQKIRVLGQSGLPLTKDDDMIQTMKKNFETTFGVESVSFDEETGFFSVRADQKAVAISADGQTGWKYLAFDKSQQAMLGPLLPKSIVEKLK